MGLYLCIFENDEDIDGVEIGPYGDFDAFRTYIAEALEGGREGSRFPVLMLHSDSDGEWTPDEAELLRTELASIREEMAGRPPIPFVSDWQHSVARSHGLVPRNALESFIDVDGEVLVDRLQSLAENAAAHRLPINFQ